ncbi:MAG: 1,4-alpha-glucan branching protein GlgB [Gammaproteobacteria bacterium]|nr:1,4-alpha-glucan branching protein GlgB [Gammaproteobacteria bacterium]
MPRRSGESRPSATEAGAPVLPVWQDRAALEALVTGSHGDPFALLGPHQDADGGWWILCWLPTARAVEVLGADGTRPLARLPCLDPRGLFGGHVPRRRQRFDYRLRVTWPDGWVETQDDPYRHPPQLGEMDLWLLAEGTEKRPWQKLGAHPVESAGVAGTRFALWAPGARRVSVVGDFNHWDETRHPMRLRREAGVWELFLPGVTAGARYKFALLDAHGAREPWRADPYAFQAEMRPATASVIAPALPAPPTAPRALPHDAPLAIYEAHAGSWQRAGEHGERWPDWDELAERLVPYVADLGFTHLELLPIAEHPFDGSWGYQPIGLYAPTARLGDAAGCARFVARCHEAGLGLILDWVPGHFPSDAHGLARFDGTHLYEHADPREGSHPDWGTLIYNYGRLEVREFLIGNARYWLECFGIDGLRVDAVASMIYRDYSRAPGEWVPNVHGGRENLEAIAFLKRLNEELGADLPAAMTIAEESTAWPGVSRPTSVGGLGFHYKWNMGWMNDTLRYFARDPIHRRHHQQDLTFSLVYAFSEHFILPLSHDEVVHGKGSLLARMPGDRWQRLANLRLLYAYMYAHPGRKLLFMGNEFAQEREWNHDASLDWFLLGDGGHRGVQSLVRDLNRLYRALPALHARDSEPGGFEWLSHDERDLSVLAFLRQGHVPEARVAVVLNFTPVVREHYRLGVPPGGAWQEVLNSDSAHYGGGNLGNGGGALRAEPRPAHGHAQSLSLTLPPLAALYLQWMPA